jgi:hypothetical protein
MTRTVALLLALVWAMPAFAEIESAVSASTGLIIANIQGYTTRTDTLPKNYDIRWLSFRSRVHAAVGELQIGLANEVQATQLMETRVGVHYYPFAYAIDFENLHQNSIIRYSAGARPYALAKLGYGRYRVKSIGTVGTAEISANYFSIGLGMGSQWNVTPTVSIDGHADASLAVGMSQIAFSAIILRPRVGIFVML